MQITRDLAEQIRDKAKAILQKEAFVANASGLILAGPRDKGKFVAEALAAAQESQDRTGRVGSHQVIWCPFSYESRPVGVFGVITDDSPITREAIGLLEGLAEVIVHQFYLIDRMHSPEMVKADFIRDFLQSHAFDSESIHRQADILQLNVRAQQAVIVVRLADFEKTIDQLSQNLSPEEQRVELVKAIERVTTHIREGFMNYPDNIASYLGHDTFVVIKGIGGGNANTINTIRFLTEKGNYIHELLSKLPQKLPVTVGIGQYYSGLGGLRKSYQDAQLALDVGGKVWGHGRVYHIKQVGMFTTLANISQDRKAELAYQILHPLLRDAQLYKTVKTFLSSGLNLTEAAKNLHIHRNTLIYRLDKTKKLVNLDPRHFDDALQIKLGLMFYQPSN
jgi:carbohydrate diacid regulator